MLSNYFVIVSTLFCLLISGQDRKNKIIRTEPVQQISQIVKNKIENKMKIEIWSDIMCPFCYIGKRKFENALETFPHKDKIEIIWKSFQLMPELKTQTERNLDQFLAEEKGITLQQAKSMNNRIVQIAKQVGLNYNLDKTIPANTFNAHRFIHFAKANGKQSESEERLFQAYFIEGQNIDNYPTLIKLGKEIGLNTEVLKTALENGTYTENVHADINEAKQVGVLGVPYFIFDRKQIISGAQESNVFLNILEKTFSQWEKDNPEKLLDIIQGQICNSDGDCK